jgi:hypothetical protein
MLDVVVLGTVGLMTALEGCHQCRTVCLASSERTCVERLHDEIVEFLWVFFRGRPCQLIVAVHEMGLFQSAF